MIPYFEQPEMSVGPFTIHAFGLLAAAGLLAGYLVAVRRAARTGLDPATASAFVIRMVVAGIVGSHLAALALSDPAALVQPRQLLAVWNGMSSVGGLLVAAAAGAWFLTRRGVQGKQAYAYFDAAAYSFPFGWMLGRAGCSLAHDHPGVPSASLLALRYPSGPRLDAGLLEFIAVAVMAACFIGLGTQRRVYLPVLLLTYGPMRFLIDTVRIGEPRFLGLTSGQYGGMLAVLAGIRIWMRVRRPRTAPRPLT